MPYAKKVKAVLDGVIYDMSSMAPFFVVQPDKDFTRDRKLPFDTLLYLLLGIRGNSINKELFDCFKEPNRLMTSSAFVQQRGKLLPEGMEFLFHEFNDRCDDDKTYHGYHLLAVDGTAVNIARNPNADSYIAGMDINQLHVNALYDLLNKVYTDCVVQARPLMNEPAAAMTMVSRYNSEGKAILMADRGYGGLNLFEACHRKKNMEYLVRVRNTGFLKEISDLPMEELDTEVSFELRTTQTNADKADYQNGTAKFISGPSKYKKSKKTVTWSFESPYRMTLRVVRFQITEDTYETIVTSLNRFEFPLKEIQKLYHMRWGIETSFRELKYAIGLTNFHAKRETFILQEIFARLTMYNFCERITLHVVIQHAEGKRHTYQVNFTMGIHICIDFFRYRGNAPPDVERQIASYVLPVREGRQDKRKLKPKSVVYFLYRVA